MNRRNRTLIVLMVAVGLASVATFFVYRAISRIPVRQVEVASIYVAVAAENLPMGTRLTKDQIKLVGWPASSPVQGSFATPDALVGRGLIQPVHCERAADRDASWRRSRRAPACRRRSLRECGRCRCGSTTSSASPASPCRAPASTCWSRSTAVTKSSMSRAVVSNVQVLTAGTLYDQEKAEGRQGHAVDGRDADASRRKTPSESRWRRTPGQIMLVLRNPLDVVPTETRACGWPA